MNLNKSSYLPTLCSVLLLQIIPRWLATAQTICSSSQLSLGVVDKCFGREILDNSLVTTYLEQQSLLVCCYISRKMNSKPAKDHSTASFLPLLRSSSASTELSQNSSTSSSGSMPDSVFDDQGTSCYIDVHGNNSGSCYTGDKYEPLRQTASCPIYRNIDLNTVLKDNKTLAENIKSIRRMFFCSVILCIAIVAAASAMLAYSISLMDSCQSKMSHTAGQIEVQVQQRLAILTDQLEESPCLDCTELGVFLGPQKFSAIQVSVNEKGLCCIKDPSSILAAFIEVRTKHRFTE